MNIIPFNFKNHNIRVIQDDNGEPWFIAKDIALALGYKDTASAVSSHCKKAKQLKDIGWVNHPPQIDQQLKLIPESDVYRLTMRSALDSAEEFQDWVVEEVLPSIRKTGSYSVSSPSLPENYIEALSALIESEKAKEIEQRKVAALTTIVDNEFGYSSILRAAQFLRIKETEFSWRPLKAEAQLLGMEVKKVPSPRFEYQLLYPIKAFENCYPQYDFMDLKPETILENTNKEISQAADNHISGVA